MIYFALINKPDTPIVKIGYTTDWKKRFEAHRKVKFGVEFDVRPLCMVRGTKADEKAIHKHFESCSIEHSDEEFFPSTSLVDWIRWLRNQYFVWVPDDDKCADIEEHDHVDASLWMPKDERTVEAPKQWSMFDDCGPLNMPPRVLTIDDFYTSDVIIEPARRSMGSIDLDPASHPVANQVVKATKFFTAVDDGLTKQWSGNVWLNPPFSQWSSWVAKILREWNDGRITSMCLLCATRTLTAQYFYGIHEQATAMCVMKGRVAFWGGRATPYPNDGHAIFYFGKNPARFAEEFKDIGAVYFSRKQP